MPLSKRAPSLVFCLAMLVALGPISTDLYLPALPTLRADFQTSIELTQLTLSSFVFGIAAFHLICGPLSDRFGRKPILLFGVTLFTLASLACTQAETITELIVYRAIQGVGACCGPVLGRAVVRDIYDVSESAKVLAYLAMIMSIAPVLAPIVGGQILQFSSWHTIFFALTLYGVASLLIISLAVPESLQTIQSLRPKQVGNNYLTLLRHREFICYCILAALLFTGTFAFISVGSFLLIEVMDVKASHFGWYFIFIVAGYVAGNAISVRLHKRLTSKHKLRLSLSLVFIAGTSMIGLCLAGISNPWAVMLPMSCHSLASGLGTPTCMAEALKPFPRIAATASSLIGFIHLGIPAIVGWVLANIQTSSALPLALTLLITSILAMGILAYLSKVKSQPSDN